MTTMNRRYPAIQGEFEDEFETEDEAFLGGLANIAGSLLGEGEDEWEIEGEDEWEVEGEEFLGGLANIAGSLLGEGEGEYEFEFEAEAEGEAESEAELEDEFEAEAEEEAEGFANPVRRVYRDAELMAHFASMAAQTESEAEAEAFIGALVPIAAKLIPRAARLISNNGPALVRGATRILRQLRRNPNTRRMVRALPVVLQRTAQSLADQAANGRPITADTVVGTLGTMTGRVLRGPAAGRAVNAVDVFNRRYHRRRRWMNRRYRYPYTGGSYTARPYAVRPYTRRVSSNYRRPTAYRGARRTYRGARRR